MDNEDQAAVVLFKCVLIYSLVPHEGFNFFLGARFGILASGIVFCGPEIEIKTPYMNTDGSYL